GQGLAAKNNKQGATSTATIVFVTDRRPVALRNFVFIAKPPMTEHFSFHRRCIGRSRHIDPTVTPPRSPFESKGTFPPKGGHSPSGLACIWNALPPPPPDKKLEASSPT